MRASSSPSQENASTYFYSRQERNTKAVEAAAQPLFARNIGKFTSVSCLTRVYPMYSVPSNVPRAQRASSVNEGHVVCVLVLQVVICGHFFAETTMV